jgi:hypothetical protein
MTKREKYLQLPTTGVTYGDVRVEDILILEDLAETKKLTDVQRHAILRIISMWHNLD